MRNATVVLTFLDGNPAWGSHLSTDGEYLISYTTRIARRYGGKMRVLNKKFSKTTSQHMNLLRLACVERGILMEAVADVDAG